MASVVGGCVDQALDLNVDSKGRRSALNNVLTVLFDAPWDSSKLDNNNPFTTAMVGRTCGILAAHGLLDPKEVRAFKRDIAGSAKSLEDVLRALAVGLPNTLKVQEYPPTPTIGYWLLDSIDNLGIELDPDTWSNFVKWASTMFSDEFSQVVAKHDAMMDPISLAMAACLSMRLRRICSRKTFPEGDRIGADLPSSPELTAAVDQFLTFQGQSGIWPKYFPLFHYPSTGSNYCLSFEVLEALILEFGSTGTLSSEAALLALNRGVRWCEANRLTLAHAGTVYSGWNSGGDRLSLQSGQPEFWATGVVHMFLSRLIETLREQIQQQVLRHYKVRIDPEPDAAGWKKIIDVLVPISAEGKPQPLKGVIEEEMIGPIEAGADPRRRSALFFGPPGTSKTTLVRALASRIGWPCVELDPSHFLRDGLEKIYASATDIFDDLDDLHRVVILFDEMDALVQKRDKNLDVTRQFLTTSMLPRLAKLHKTRDVLFFFATNHLGYFDEAIKRPGRFDLLLLVQPPGWAEKMGRPEVFCESGASTADSLAARTLMLDWIPLGSAIGEHLDLFTVDEFASLLEHIRRTTKKDRTRDALDALGKAKFEELVEEWRTKYINLRPGNAKGFKEFEDDRRSSRRQ